MSCGFILGFACDWYESIDHHSDENLKIPKNLIWYDISDIDSIKDLVLKGKGDEDVCSYLFQEYIYVHYSQEFLLYSLIMANKFNIPSAYYFVYSDWTGIYDIHFRDEKIDERTKNIAMDYLRRGVELKDNSSIGEMEDIYHK